MGRGDSARRGGGNRVSMAVVLFPAQLRRPGGTGKGLGRTCGPEALAAAGFRWRVFSLFITDLIEGSKGRGAGRTVARQEFGWKGAIAETR